MTRRGKSWHNILLERRGPVAVVTVNRPEKRNALSAEAIGELGEVVDLLAGDSETRAVVLTGAGDKAFISGGDLRELEEITTEADARAFAASMRGVLGRLAGLKAPVIAAINGGAFGGGCEAAVSCDLRLASDRAVLAFRQVKIAVAPGWGGGQRLLRLVGRSRALGLLLTGEAVSAERALQLGLVDEVVPHDRLMDRAMELAEIIAANPPLAVRGIKEAINRGADLPLETAIDAEIDIFAHLWLTRDHREAIRAFLENREPRFLGE